MEQDDGGSIVANVHLLCGDISQETKQILEEIRERYPVVDLTGICNTIFRETDAGKLGQGFQPQRVTHARALQEVKDKMMRPVFPREPAKYVQSLVKGLWRAELLIKENSSTWLASSKSLQDCHVTETVSPLPQPLPAYRGSSTHSHGAKLVDSIKVNNRLHPQPNPSTVTGTRRAQGTYGISTTTCDICNGRRIHSLKPGQYKGKKVQCCFECIEQLKTEFKPEIFRTRSNGTALASTLTKGVRTVKENSVWHAKAVPSDDDLDDFKAAEKKEEVRAPKCPMRQTQTASEKADVAAVENETIDILDSDEEQDASQPAVGAPTTRRKTARGNAWCAICRQLEGFKCLYQSLGGKGSVEVRATDLSRLEPGEMLNDTIIDYYMAYLSNELLQRDPESWNRCHFFNSFFYKKLTESSGGSLPEAVLKEVEEGKYAQEEVQALRNHEKVRKWTKDCDIFSKDYLFIPVHMDLHWSLIIVCHPGATEDEVPVDIVEDSVANRQNPYPRTVIIHLDSLAHGGHSTKKATDLVRYYLRHEWQSHSREQEKPGSRVKQWTVAQPDKERRIDMQSVTSHRLPVPTQANHWDCGLYMLSFIDYFIYKLPKAVNSAAVLDLRKAFLKDDVDICDGASYPGILTKHWFPRSNPENLRYRIRLDILRLLGEDAQIPFDEESDTFVADNLESPEKAKHAAAALQKRYESTKEEVLNLVYLTPEAYFEDAKQAKMKRNIQLQKKAAIQQQEEEEKKMPRSKKSSKQGNKSRWGSPSQKRQHQASMKGFIGKACNSQPDYDFGLVLDSDSEDTRTRRKTKARGGFFVTRGMQQKENGVPSCSSPSEQVHTDVSDEVVVQVEEEEEEEETSEQPTKVRKYSGIKEAVLVIERSSSPPGPFNLEDPGKRQIAGMRCFINGRRSQMVDMASMEADLEVGEGNSGFQRKHSKGKRSRAVVKDEEVQQFWRTNVEPSVVP